MRFIAIGLSTAILAIGCAMQTGEPTGGDPSQEGTSGAGATTRVDNGRSPYLRPAPSPAPTGSSGEPEPATWNVGSPFANGGNADQGTGTSPEPSPWNLNPTISEGTNPQPAGGSGTTGGSNAAARPHALPPSLPRVDLEAQQIK